MSNIRDVQEKIQKQLDEINIEALNDKLKLIGYFHDRMVPILNEVMTSSASEAKDYEDAYKIVTTKLRNIIASITAEKRNSEAALMTSVGKRDALEDILKDVSEIAQKTKQNNQNQ